MSTVNEKVSAAPFVLIGNTDADFCGVEGCTTATDEAPTPGRPE